jgi:FtsP/CotA-like multicopper oxidase with cupredoxin domain
MNNDNHTHGLSNHQTKRGARALRPALWRRLSGKAVAVAAAVAAAAVVTLWLLPTRPARAADPTLTAQLLSEPFTNPNEIRADRATKRLRGVLQIVSGKYRIPNVGNENMRQYRGWDMSRPAPTPVPAGVVTGVEPGPTWRARLGDRVEVAFLNKADNRDFSYTTNTESTPDDPPGRSSFGCDTSGLRDPVTGKFPIYPANDKFPNCFHGSSTANVHYHGTHASPDGVGDNVLVQVIPDPNQRDWLPIFNEMFNSGVIPQRWEQMPASFRTEQMKLIKDNDAAATKEAAKNNLRAPASLFEKNEELIAEGQWPVYFYGAYPNFWEIPDYDDTAKGWGAGQAPGTHWYHAHKHGSTSLHILNGLAGALIIESSREGGYDHVIRKFYGWGDTYGNHEKIFVFQQFDPTQNLQRGQGINPGVPNPRGKGIKQVLVNGKLTPTITMRPGEVMLWRMINATEGNNQGIINAGTTTGSPGMFMLAGNGGFHYRQTAADGVQFSPENYASQPFLNGTSPGGVKLGGGNRADLLVQAPTRPGTYEFKNFSPGNATLFFVKVEGPAVILPAPFPTAWAELPKFLRDLPAPGPYDLPNPNSPVKFQWEPGRTSFGRLATPPAPPPPAPSPTPVRNPTTPPPGNPPHFMINNKQFGEMGDIVDQCMPLDGLQDWVLENYTTGIAHPFHIHINPFQVLKIETPTALNQYSVYEPKKEDQSKNVFVWQDVIAIPPAVMSADGSQITPGRVTIRQTYKDFIGTYVLHCHILAHEDRGMMQLVRVVPKNRYPQGCQTAVPPHH